MNGNYRSPEDYAKLNKEINRLRSVGKKYGEISQTLGINDYVYYKAKNLKKSKTQHSNGKFLKFTAEGVTPIQVNLPGGVTISCADAEALKTVLAAIKEN